MANTVKRKVDEYEKPADAVAYDNALKNLERPNEINSTHLSKMNDIVSKIESREPFTYDINADMLYQQYKDAANRNGNLAMQDAIGKASAMTGGYGNSYAQQVGQQTYNNYLQQLNDKIPELYQLAYDKYNQEGNQLKDLYSLYGNMYEREYGEYRDKLTDYNNERAYLTDAARYSDQTGYSRWSDNAERRYRDYRDSVADDHYDTEYADKKAQQEWENQFRTDQYTDNKAQQDKENQRYDDQQEEQAKEKNRENLYGLIGMGYTPSAQDLSDAGMTEKEYSTMKSYYSKPTTQPKSIDAGSDAYAAIMSEVDSATSIGDLADIVDRYVAMGYSEDEIAAMAASKAKELEKKGTAVLPKGANPFTDFFKK